MKKLTWLSSRLAQALFVAAPVLLSSVLARGDTIYTSAGKQGKAFPTPDVTVKSITKVGATEYLVYENSQGNENRKVLETIVQIEVPGEDVFNRAEVAYLKGDPKSLKAAGDDYQKVTKSGSAKEWMKTRASGRLITISEKTGDFLGAVRGFVERAQKEPATASKHVPAIPATLPKDQLDQAIAAVKDGLLNTQNNTKVALLGFLNQLYIKSGNTVESQKTLDQLGKLQSTASVSGDPAEEDAKRQALLKGQADLSLGKASSALQAGKFADAIKEINEHRATFVDADSQYAALYCLAQSMAGDAKTPEDWQAAALAYMRVVAFFANRPFAADALYQTGMILEKHLGKSAEAGAIYQQVIDGYKTSTDPAAVKAVQAATAAKNSLPKPAKAP